MTVEEEGVRRWLKASGRTGDLEQLRARAQTLARDRGAPESYARRSCARCMVPGSIPARMRVRKAAAFAALRESYARLVQGWGPHPPFDGLVREERHQQRPSRLHRDLLRLCARVEAGAQPRWAATWMRSIGACASLPSSIRKSATPSYADRADDARVSSAPDLGALGFAPPVCTCPAADLPAAARSRLKRALSSKDAEVLARRGGHGMRLDLELLEAIVRAYAIDLQGAVVVAGEWPSRARSS